MSEKIGWVFPSSDGGELDGYNDPGIAHFKGSPLSSLAREILQNSLDAAKNSDSEIHVSFELIELGIEDIGGHELLDSVNTCLSQAVDDEDEDILTISELKEASRLLNNDKINCLRISDRDTTGLQGKYWKALVKMRGTSRKKATGAGGTHGLGKNAPFAVSGLRTIFYWTCYMEGKDFVEKMQGKSILMSHRDATGNETQGTGFYGYRDGCVEICNDKISNKFGCLNQMGTLFREQVLLLWDFKLLKIGVLKLDLIL